MAPRRSITPIYSSFGRSPYSTDVAMALRLKERSIHRFAISHSQTKDAARGQLFSSPVFTVGGHSWSILYYPRGNPAGDGNSIGLFLTKLAESGNAIAVFILTLLSKSDNLTSATSRRALHHFRETSRVFGWQPFAEQRTVDCCVYQDSLIFECDIAVYESASHDGAANKVVTPQSEVLANKVVMPHSEVLGTLWESKDMVDVSFLVDGETVTAHRLVLAASSPVFKAMFYGSMAETKMDYIPILDMKASIFKAMLHYIYTDLFPESILSEGCASEFSIGVQHLFKAADLYQLDSLKLICEEKLSKDISIDTVVTTLALAHQYNCSHLKRICFEFLLVAEHFVEVLPTHGFAHIMQIYPEVIAELRAKIIDPSILQNIVDQMRRISHS